MKVASKSDCLNGFQSFQSTFKLSGLQITGTFVISVVFSKHLKEQSCIQWGSFAEDPGDSCFWGHAPYPHTFLRLQTPGGVTAVCWNANVSPTMRWLLQFPICHRICSLPTALGPELVSVHNIPAVWWIHPLPRLSAPVSDRRVSFLPLSIPHVLHISAPLFFISQRKKY